MNRLNVLLEAVRLIWMSQGTEDSQDLAFGFWLKEQRNRCGLGLNDVYEETGIKIQRLLELELGRAKKGITKREAILLAAVYGLDPSNLEAQLFGRMN